MTQPIGLCLIGCGRMGQALLDGWERTKLIDKELSLIIDPSDEARHRAQTSHIPYLPSTDAIKVGFPSRIVILAVKPQICDEVLQKIHPFITSQHLLISIAAGRNIATLSHHLRDAAPIIRVMPNLPVSIGQGISAAYANSFVKAQHRETTTTLFESCGVFLWAEDEQRLDSIAALSGSGPAYLFYFVEALTKAGMAIGIDHHNARLLARHVVIGAGALLHDDQVCATELRQQVTSPGGMTAAAIHVLETPANIDFNTFVEHAVRAAYQRSKELSH